MPGSLRPAANVLCHYHNVGIAPLQPTVCHYFIRLLKEKGLLLRCYTQVGATGGNPGQRAEGDLPGVSSASGPAQFLAT